MPPNPGNPADPSEHALQKVPAPKTIQALAAQPALRASPVHPAWGVQVWGRGRSFPFLLLFPAGTQGPWRALSGWGRHDLEAGHEPHPCSG